MNAKGRKCSDTSCLFYISLRTMNMEFLHQSVLKDL